MLPRLMLAGTMLTIVLPLSARSALITVSSASFDPTDASIAVVVQLENDSADPLNLAAFSLQLRVTPTGPRRVEFNASAQPDTLSDPGYIFFANSASQSGSVVPWSVQSVAGGTSNQLTFTDTTDDTLDVTQAAFSSRILARITLVPGTGASAPIPGDVFILALIPGGTSIFDTDLSPVGFTTGTGTLTVRSDPGAVPEPATLALAGLGALILGVRGRSRARLVSKSA